MREVVEEAILMSTLVSICQPLASTQASTLVHTSTHMHISYITHTYTYI